jgi:hypothetical protein
MRSGDTCDDRDARLRYRLLRARAREAITGKLRHKCHERHNHLSSRAASRPSRDKRHFFGGWDSPICHSLKGTMTQRRSAEAARKRAEP